MRAYKTPHFLPRLRAADSGSVITEAVVVIPLLLLFIISILEAGRTASMVARAAQSAYNATLIGGKTPATLRDQAMHQRAQELNSYLVSDLINISMVPSDNATDRTVTFAYQADLAALFPSSHWGVGLQMTGPDLIIGTGGNVNFNQFGNGACYYNCSLQLTATCPPPAASGCAAGLPPKIDPRTDDEGVLLIDPNGNVLDDTWDAKYVIPADGILFPDGGGGRGGGGGSGGTDASFP